jgi:two-component system, chemotaxis family, chemotaxis protein CheY
VTNVGRSFVSRTANHVTVCLATKVLIIEDDVDVLETLANVLELEGYVPVLATNGRAGIALFQTQAPAVVVTDIFMPEQEGIETIIQMRRLRPDAKIIAISGGGYYRRMEYLEIAAQLGATAIIAKPFEPDELVDTVGRVLSHRK